MTIRSTIDASPQCLSGKAWKHEARRVDVFIVVSAELLFFFKVPVPQWHFDISVLILAAHHEANLSAGVCRNGGVSVLDSREDFLA